MDITNLFDVYAQCMVGERSRERIIIDDFDTLRIDVVFAILVDPFYKRT